MSETDDVTATGRELPCGRDPIEVVDRVRQGHGSEHEQGCAFCQAAIGTDTVARAAAAELARSEHAEAVPETLVPDVMRSVWSDLRRSTMLPLTTGAGSAFVADHAVAAVIERAVDEVPELRVHTCLVRPAADATGTVTVDVRAAAAYNSDVRSVAAAARGLARRVVAEQFGWTAEPVDIEVVDVFVPDGPDLVDTRAFDGAER